MEITVRTVDGVTVVDLTGELDGNGAAAAQAEILPLAGRGGKLLLEMSGVTYMSSAGLRLLLGTYRRITDTGGRVAILGLSEELRDVMAMTGFLNFFILGDTMDSAIEALNR